MTKVMIVYEDGGAFLAITRPGQPVERIPLTERDVARLMGEVARAWGGDRSRRRQR